MVVVDVVSDDSSGEWSRGTWIVSLIFGCCWLLLVVIVVIGCCCWRKFEDSGGERKRKGRGEEPWERIFERMKGRAKLIHRERVNF